MRRSNLLIERILENMNDEILDDSDFEVIDVTPKLKSKPRWRLWIILAIILVSIFSLP